MIELGAREMQDKESTEVKNIQDSMFKLFHRVGMAQITYLTLQHMEEGRLERACALADCVTDLLSLIATFSECLTAQNEALEVAQRVIAGKQEEINLLEAENAALKRELAGEMEKY